MATQQPLLIGIAGGSGSGKTTFLRALFEAFQGGELALVSQDNYYHPIEKQQRDQNGEVNFDLPESIDRKHFFEDIHSLVSGKPITKVEYTFNNSTRVPEHIVIQPAPVIITEGLFVFHYEEICQQLNYKVFLDAHHETRLERRIRRDQEERGYPEDAVRYQWHHHVLPAEQSWLDPFKPHADLVVDNTHSFEEGLEALKHLIRKHLQQ
ncbi:MAG: hypothetical protein KDC12_06000 [Flavobacteriales bacterium]|nr:hypothetical protein [Flavobacteriales bacterium]